tara:strand:- start:1320 stop:1529 length:210 start_codon:yes stop_codon:yes gene_type:complete
MQLKQFVRGVAFYVVHSFLDLCKRDIGLRAGMQVGNNESSAVLDERVGHVMFPLAFFAPGEFVQNTADL